MTNTQLTRVVGIVVCIALAIGLVYWRVHAGKPHRPTVPNGSHEVTLSVGGAGTDRELTMTVTDVRTNRAVSATAPFEAAGGDWTVLDCAARSDPSARITVAVRAAVPSTQPSPVPISFSKVEVLPGDRAAGDRLVSLLAGSLRHQRPGPATRPTTPLRPIEVPIAVLGDHLSGPADGLRSGGGSWVATKWFLTDHTGDTDAEIFFNYDLATRCARFSEKDDDYDDDVLAALATALRDGPAPAAPLNHAE